jgi:hypothetical protein
MSKAVIIKDLTSQLIQMNFVCTYHPKNDIYSDMFFDCQNSDEEPSKINLKLAISVDEKQKQLKYAHRISEYTTSDPKNKVQLLDPIEGFHQFVSYQTITGKIKHIYLDPEEISELIEKISKKQEYTFMRMDNIDFRMSKKVERRPAKQSVPVLSIVTLLILSALSLLFQQKPQDWIISLVLAILFILSTQMIPQRKFVLTAGWITMQMLIWLLY